MTGRDSVRESAGQLAKQLPDPSFEYSVKHVDGEYAFLLWRGDPFHARAEHGVDSFVIHDGRIVMQSVYYALQPK